MARDRSKTPLSRKVIVGALLGEFVLGLVLAVTVGALAATTVAEQHRESTQDVASTLAAVLMPVIADQQRERAATVLENIMASSDLSDVECVRVVDSSGQEVVAHGDVAACMVAPGVQPETGLLDILFESRLVSESIRVSGLEVATVHVGLAPPDLAEVLTIPLSASALVLVAVMLVSVPWTMWLVNREVVEPLQHLEEYASRIAEGELEPGPGVHTSAEVDGLQTALESMAVQLATQRAQLEGSYDDLSAAYEALEKAKVEIEQLARIKEDFVAVAAHEIRAPLSTIRLHAETLRTGEVGQLDDEARQSVASIYSAASRLGSIASDLMDAALLDRGELPMRFETLWLDELVEEAVRDADVLARKRDMRVRTAGDLKETVLRADGMRLRQVMDNLLSNAIKYSPEGSQVVVSIDSPGDDVVVEVADNGIGIDPAASERLFTLFGRLDLEDSRETAGLGLGLAISARIVKAHGGSISVRENHDGGGSVFSVRLPRDRVAEGATGHSAFVRVAEEEDAT